MGFENVLKLEELPDGTLKRIQFKNLDLLLYAHLGQISAVSGRCTHLNSRLPEAHIVGIVTCPFHGAQFRLQTGECVVEAFTGGRTIASNSSNLECFPVRILEHWIQIDCDSSSH